MKTNLSMATRLQYTKFGLIEKSVYDVIEIIRTGDMQVIESVYGGYSLKDITVAIRCEPDPNRQNEWKERFLPVVFFNGVWDGAKIGEYSNCTVLDFDHIGTDAQLDQILTRLKSTPFVLAVFRTFKPRRIKALVMHDNTDPARHREMYEQLIGHFGADGIDQSCKDISRKTFLPWDEDIWVNPNCQPYHFVPSMILPQKCHSPLAVINGTQKQRKPKSPQSIINILNSSWRAKHPEFWRVGYRANSIFKCACQFCEYGVPQDMAENYFLTGGWINDDFTEEEVFKHVRGAYGYNKDRYGSKVFI